MGMTKTFKDVMTPEVTKLDDGKVRIIFSMHGVEMFCLYYEKPKRAWTRKPIMPKVWTCVDAKVTDSSVYIQGLCTPRQIQEWGNEVLLSFIFPKDNVIDSDNKPSDK